METVQNHGTLVAVIKLMSWIKVVAVLAGAVIAVVPYKQLRSGPLLFFAGGLDLMAFSLVIGPIYEALQIGLLGSLITPEDVARAVPFSSGVLLLGQMLALAGAVLIVLGVLKMGHRDTV